MAKKNMAETTNEKIQTKYDRKIEARKQKEIQDKKDAKKYKIISSLVIAFIVIAITAGIVTPIYLTDKEMKDTYVVVGDREVSGLEYDYYYNAAVNSFLTSYASFLPYLGLDTSIDYAEQAFSETLSWKDEFDRMAAEQMRQIFALSKEAKNNGFEYDTESEYQTHQENLKEAAAAQGVSLAEYYKSSFGKNATVANMEPIIKEGIYACAYQDELILQNPPTQEEITAYYNENKANYDLVDYRSFVFTASVTSESTEDEIASAMEELKMQADTFVSERSAGSDFEELCVQYASGTTKANYENEETEYSLSEGKNNASIPSDISPWLFEEERCAGDITVIKSASYNQYYVVEFIQRYEDESADENISNYLASLVVSEQIIALTEQYPVNDVNGNFKYLSVE